MGRVTQQHEQTLVNGIPPGVDRYSRQEMGESGHGQDEDLWVFGFEEEWDEPRQSNESLCGREDAGGRSQRDG